MPWDQNSIQSNILISLVKQSVYDRRSRDSRRGKLKGGLAKQVGFSPDSLFLSPAFESTLIRSTGTVILWIWREPSVFAYTASKLLQQHAVDLIYPTFYAPNRVYLGYRIHRVTQWKQNQHLPPCLMRQTMTQWLPSRYPINSPSQSTPNRIGARSTSPQPQWR